MNIIEFTAPKRFIDSNKEILPVPIKTNIPEWYKKLKYSIHNKTIKGCMPFLETLTTGYLLKMPQDLYIRHNVINPETKQKDTYHTYALNGVANELRQERVNLNAFGEMHAAEQLEGSPLVEKNKNLPFYKIHNPWHIRTPKGYSCLFLPPLNNKDDRFEIIPGIVETDIFQMEINFPFVINGDKYPNLETTIKYGTPIVQVIPFKRDDWKMKIIEKDNKDHSKDHLFFFKDLIHSYKIRVHKKRKWI